MWAPGKWCWIIPWSSIRALFRSSWHFQETCRKHQSHQAKKWHEIVDQICIKHFWQGVAPLSRIHRQSILHFFQWPMTHTAPPEHPLAYLPPPRHAWRKLFSEHGKCFSYTWAHYAWSISKSFVLDQHIDIPIFSPQGGTHRPEDTLRFFSYVPSKKRFENILITLAFQGASPWLRNARSGSTSAGLVVKLRSSPANSSTSWEVIGWCKWHEKHRIYRSNLCVYIYKSNIMHTPNILYKSCVETYYDHIMYNLWHSKKHIVIQPYWKPYDTHTNWECGFSHSFLTASMPGTLNLCP